MNKAKYIDRSIMNGYLVTSSWSLGAVLALFYSAMATAVPLKAVQLRQVIRLDESLALDCDSPLASSRYQKQNNSSCSQERHRGWNQSSRENLKRAIDNSLDYLSTSKAAKDYLDLPPEFSLEKVRRSLIRFRHLLISSPSPAALERAVRAEFTLYESLGKDNRGTVEFTGYFQPVYEASRVPTAEYRYPLYRLPASLNSQAHPTRVQLEGIDGLGSNESILSGQELVWLRDRLEAYLVQVQGSAQLRLSDGKIMNVGFDGSTDYPYVSIGAELVKEGVFTKEELSLPKVIAHFQENPALLDLYIPRNDRFIFFRETQDAAAVGSLGVPVTGNRSIATDKALMPPGALALIVAPIPEIESTGAIATNTVSRYVLDQDTGSAIVGAGRVDLFLGSGQIAGERAGRLNGTGKLYYLLLKE